MSESLAASDWVAARGEKWRAQLPGMEAMLEPVDAPLVDALALDEPVRIAEVGCGGGGTALELRRRAPAGSVIHGFDLSPGLIELARRRARPDDRAITFEVADMATAAPSEPYDRLVSRFGIMFFEHPTAAFANLVRWLVPGGRLAFAVWGPPPENPWMTSVRDVVARAVALPPADPHAPGPFRYADSDELLALLDRVGFTKLEVRDFRGTLPIGGRLDPAEAARFALSSFSSFGERLAAAGEDAFGQAHRSLTACFARHRHDGAIRMDARVHIVTGMRR